MVCAILARCGRFLSFCVSGYLLSEPRFFADADISGACLPVETRYCVPFISPRSNTIVAKIWPCHPPPHPKQIVQQLNDMVVATSPLSRPGAAAGEPPNSLSASCAMAWQSSPPVLSPAAATAPTTCASSVPPPPILTTPVRTATAAGSGGGGAEGSAGWPAGSAGSAEGLMEAFPLTGLTFEGVFSPSQVRV